MEDFKKLYDDFLENDEEAASEEVRDTYSAMKDEFEEYICAIQEDTFRKAYNFGFERGIAAAGKEDFVK